MSNKLKLKVINVDKNNKVVTFKDMDAIFSLKNHAGVFRVCHHECHAPTPAQFKRGRQYFHAIFSKSKAVEKNNLIN